MKERLQKVMAQSGVASRRRSEEIIAEGRVSVNGEKVTEIGVKVGPKDIVQVDGRPLVEEDNVYFLLYKPRDIISAVSDDKNRPVVVDLLRGVTERIYPVGRLDYDTSGALLLTNDGDFAYKLTHPRFEVKKTYVAKVEGIVFPKNLLPFNHGIKIDHEKTAPAKFKILSTDNNRKTSIVQLTIHEGRNHQVKKMFEAVGHPVLKLKREMFGNITLAGLQSGQYRALSRREVRELLELAE